MKRLTSCSGLFALTVLAASPLAAQASTSKVPADYRKISIAQPMYIGIPPATPVTGSVLLLDDDLDPAGSDHDANLNSAGSNILVRPGDYYLKVAPDNGGSINLTLALASADQRLQYRFLISGTTAAFKVSDQGANVPTAPKARCTPDAKGGAQYCLQIPRAYNQFPAPAK